MRSDLFQNSMVWNPSDPIRSETLRFGTATIRSVPKQPVLEFVTPAAPSTAR
jgi:hypothetical protein